MIPEADNSPSNLPHHTNVRTFDVDVFNVHQLLFNAKPFVVPGLEHWTRVHNHDHQATVAAKENSKFERNVMEKYI
ncbi:hypothetical protein TNCV_1686171 [Trichonephila clavipes]|nr:hypothetical protein TNCV_1686171 [Trichonephila clavipes]